LSAIVKSPFFKFLCNTCFSFGKHIYHFQMEIDAVSHLFFSATNLFLTVIFDKLIFHFGNCEILISAKGITQNSQFLQ